MIWLCGNPHFPGAKKTSHACQRDHLRGGDQSSGRVLKPKMARFEGACVSQWKGTGVV